MSLKEIATVRRNIGGESMKSVPLAILLKLNYALRKTVFSRKFYQEISDKVLASSSTVDTNLYFICYFTLLVSSVLNNKPQIRQFLRKQRKALIKLVNGLSMKALNTDLRNSSNKKVAQIFSEQDSDVTDDQEKTESEPSSELAVYLKNISSYISDIRIFARLTDAIKYMPWIIDEYVSFMDPASPVPRFNRFIDFLQSLNCLVLELFENVGWLTDHNWIGTSDNDYWCMETYLWCSRVWGAYIVLNVIEMIRRTPVSKWDKSWRVGLFKEVVQIPMVVHWSLREGCLTPFWVGLCGSCTSWWNFKAMWSSLDLS